jgi:hypothetical protein
MFRAVKNSKKAVSGKPQDSSCKQNTYPPFMPHIAPLTAVPSSPLKMKQGSDFCYLKFIGVILIN